MSVVICKLALLSNANLLIPFTTRINSHFNTRFYYWLHPSASLTASLHILVPFSLLSSVSREPASLNSLLATSPPFGNGLRRFARSAHGRFPLVSSSDILYTFWFVVSLYTWHEYFIRSFTVILVFFSFVASLYILLSFYLRHFTINLGSFFSDHFPLCCVTVLFTILFSSQLHCIFFYSLFSIVSL